MESLKNDLIRASNADRALQIIDDNRECLSDETIRSALANRASNVVCSISRDNVNAYVNAIIDRKMDQYNRVATAVNALNNSKAELAREKEALENELSHLGIFAGKRKKEIRAWLEAMPEKQATLISQGTQAIADADSPSL